MKRKKISVIFGTRPEAIKLAPVILALKKDRRFICKVCVTAQHREMLDQVLEVFGIKPDVDLNLMRRNQTLSDFAARALVAIDKYLTNEKPDFVLVQGDTTTVFCAALASFYHHIPLGHVEAGLRTWNFNAPWPEEANRVLTSRIGTLHFAPTMGNRRNLLKERIATDRVFVTGNTVIDALFLALAKVKKCPPDIDGLPDFLQPGKCNTAGKKPRIVLITGHRRENFGKGFENICRAIAVLAKRFPDVHFVYPVHLNPNVREPVYRILGQHSDKSSFCIHHSELENVHLIAPQSYLSFVALMNRSSLILTDSGGVQEEAPSLGKPVLVMRDVTERPEAVDSGAVKLVGTSRKSIVRTVGNLLTDSKLYKRMRHTRNPYGDGKAAERIIKVLVRFIRSQTH
ncbi:MAG: UDP-N-acetylglucosamine 2-epimerase [Lentisphaerae bacterium RIFOXYA12_FULL_48_11]|nr:MAG: UDP-N-acetylglucosamine 2-epimerase [Lentisphaerae bacterium RIFOXYA12_FULL_48_11]